MELRSGTNSSSDPETVHAIPGVGYDVELALAAEKREQEMSFWDAVKADKRLIMYTIGFSGTIIMEGYGLATMGNLLGIYNFNKMFGDAHVSPDGTPIEDKNYPGQHLQEYGVSHLTLCRMSGQNADQLPSSPPTGRPCSVSWLSSVP